MRPHSVTLKIRELLPTIGGELIVEPSYQHAGCILFDNGKRSFFRGSIFGVNPQSASKISLDKGYTNFFLQKFGFQVPDYDVFINNWIGEKQQKGINEGLSFAKKIGFPVIIKPNDGFKGKFVKKVNSEEEYWKYAKDIFDHYDLMMVQKVAIGKEFRIVVFNQKVYYACQKVPLQVTGNGMNTIAELLRDYFQKIEQTHKREAKSIKQHIQKNLLQKGLTNQSILAPNQTIQLFDILNLSLGSTVIDCTNKMSPAFEQLAIDITQKMGLILCGIDLITPSIETAAQEYAIIEINSAPGFQFFASMGATQSQMVDTLYLDILKYLKHKTH